MHSPRTGRLLGVAIVLLALSVPSSAVVPVSPLLLARLGKLIWDVLTFRHRTPVPPPNVKLSPDQSVDIPSLSTATAEQKCENWAWAAGLETILRTQNVDLKQKYWVLKSDGGELCKDGVDLGSRVPYINGEYVLDDGRHVRLQATAIEGLPQGIDAFILAPQEGRPLMLMWKGHPYLYVGMNFEELRFANGQREFAVTKFKFLDPFASNAAGQVVYFDREKDNIADISEMMDVIVTPIEGTDWLHPEKELDHPTR